MAAGATLAALVESQVDTYVEAGYPALAGLDEAAFRALAGPVVAAARGVSVPGDGAVGAGRGVSVPNGEVRGGEVDAAGGEVSAVLVVTRRLIDDEARVPLLRLVDSDKPGILDKNHSSDARAGLSHYVPRAELEIPDTPMYLLIGVERGDEYRNVAPADALESITARGRTPLTIDEGISLATVAPEVIVKNHCFSLAGSTRGDKRVPAIWISERAPKLGWCFDRVPHTWLGLASASGRVAP